jgi:hypothetical protein
VDQAFSYQSIATNTSEFEQMLGHLDSWFQLSSVPNQDNLAQLSMTLKVDLASIGPVVLILESDSGDSII